MSIHLWLVDDDYIIKALYPDWTEGGHWLVYNFIPEGEIWLSNQVRPMERAFIVAHELFELVFMLEGDDYGTAHEKASGIEYDFRNHPEQLAEYGLQDLIPIDTISGIDAAYELRMYVPHEQAIADQLGQIAWDNRGDLKKLKQEFLDYLRKALLAILLILGYNTAESEAVGLMEAALTEQSGYLDWFIKDIENLSQAQVEARAALYAGSLGSYYNQWWLRQQGEQRLKWQYNPEAKHCGDCLELDGQIRTAKQWLAAGLWPRSGNTQCLSNCRCDLNPV